MTEHSPFHTYPSNIPSHQNISHISATEGGRVFAGVHVHTGHERPLNEILPVASQAAFDASSRQDHPLCLEDTRTEVLKHIRAWVYGEEASCIFWLNGMAGTGKSTIAQTIAQELSSKKYLGASFFFVRGGGDVSHTGMFFSSIAYQLAICQPNIRHHIVEAVQQQEDIATKSRTEQWRQLIAQPLEKAKGQTQQPTVVLVIDALDECDNDNDMKGLIAVLAQAGDVTAVRLRIIVTSRPETPIRLGFKKTPQILHRDLLLHEVPREVVDADICLFLYNQLEEVGEMFSLPKGWPGVDHINQLVCASAGLFIFAATVCRFLQECDMSVEDGLDLFLPQSRLPNYDEGRGESTRFLDAMYSQVLARSLGPTARRAALKEARNPVKDMLGAIAALSEPLSIGSLAGLLSVRESEINQRLSRLHSVVRIPAATELPIRLFHTSLRDFLFDAQRSSDSGFAIDRRDVHAQLLQHCLVAMKSTLRRDMCNLCDPCYKASQIDREVVNACIPSHVQYACQYWVHHFYEARPDSNAISDFFCTHVVYWIEAMSLIGRLEEAVHMVVLLRKTTVASESFADFLQDALRFLLFSRAGIEQAPLQTYEFALLFAPKASTIRQKFSHEMPKRISRIGQEEEEWDACLLVLDDHSRYGNAVAFSRDGNMLASASYDQTVRLWDTTSGHSVHRLVGRPLYEYVNAVAFSPDGKMLASASDDKIVRLWDTTSGALLQSIDNIGYITTLAFSHDGTKLETNKGIIALGRNKLISTRPVVSPPDYTYVKDSWLHLDQRPWLWLPPKYTATCTSTWSNLVAIGHRSGLVTLWSINKDST